MIKQRKNWNYHWKERRIIFQYTKWYNQNPYTRHYKHFTMEKHRSDIKSNMMRDWLSLIKGTLHRAHIATRAPPLLFLYSWKLKELKMQKQQLPIKKTFLLHPHYSWFRFVSFSVIYYFLFSIKYNNWRKAYISWNAFTTCSTSLEI